MERLPAWDPFYPTPGDPGPREPNEAPLVSLFLCLAGEQAVFCRVEGEHIGPRVSLVARHGTSPFTCGAPARALATIFLGAASGNILAFPARVQANNMGGSQVVREDIVMTLQLKIPGVDVHLAWPPWWGSSVVHHWTGRHPCQCWH